MYILYKEENETLSKVSSIYIWHIICNSMDKTVWNVLKKEYKKKKKTFDKIWLLYFYLKYITTTSYNGIDRFV